MHREGRLHSEGHILLSTYTNEEVRREISIAQIFSV